MAFITDAAAAGEFNDNARPEYVWTASGVQVSCVRNDAEFAVSALIDNDMVEELKAISEYLLNVPDGQNAETLYDDFYSRFSETISELRKGLQFAMSFAPIEGRGSGVAKIIDIMTPSSSRENNNYRLSNQLLTTERVWWPLIAQAYGNMYTLRAKYGMPPAFSAVCGLLLARLDEAAYSDEGMRAAVAFGVSAATDIMLSIGLTTSMEDETPPKSIENPRCLRSLVPLVQNWSREYRAGNPTMLDASRLLLLLSTDKFENTTEYDNDDSAEQYSNSFVDIEDVSPYIGKKAHMTRSFPELPVCIGCYTIAGGVCYMPILYAHDEYGIPCALIPENIKAYRFLCSVYGLKAWNGVTSLRPEDAAHLDFGSAVQRWCVAKAVGDMYFYAGPASLVDYMKSFSGDRVPDQAKMLKFYNGRV